MKHSPIEQHLFVRAFFGESLSAYAASRIVTIMREVFLGAGQIVYRSGEPADHIYCIVDGRIRLSGGASPDRLVGAGQLFGGLEVQILRDRLQTATVERDTRLYAMRASDWLDVVEEDFDLARTRLESSSAQMRARSASLDGEQAARARSDEDAGMGLVDPGSADRVLGRLLAMRRAPVFALARVQPLLSLARLATAHHLAAGQSGHYPGQLCLVVAGWVESAACRHEPGELLGRFAAFDPAYEATARAVDGDAVVICFERERLYDVMEDHFDMLRSILRHQALYNDRFDQLAQFAAAPTV
jgi:CRP-like cAMP-binding protein